jgi:hypothetical protein
MQVLYPDIRTYAEHRLQVDNIHSLYVEESGNPDGIPALFVHGGPVPVAENTTAVFSIPNAIASYCSISAAPGAPHRMRSWKTTPPRTWWRTWRP